MADVGWQRQTKMRTRESRSTGEQSNTGNPLLCHHVCLKVKYSKACTNWQFRKCSITIHLEQLIGSLWLHVCLARTDWQPCQKQFARTCWLSSECEMDLVKAFNPGNRSTDIAEHRLACLGFVSDAWSKLSLLIDTNDHNLSHVCRGAGAFIQTEH